MNENASPEKKKKKRWKVIVGILLGVPAVLCIAAFAYLAHLYWLTHYESEEEIRIYSGVPDDPDGDYEGEDEDVTKPLSPEELEEIEAVMAGGGTNISDEGVMSSPDVYNLLLVGVDRRTRSWNGNSDAMVLLSLNEKNGTVKLVSFMRDLYANIPGYGVRKLNAACAIGGCPLLVKTIEQNYKVKIDNYAWVDFDGMKEVIDTVGGVDIHINEAEAKHLGIAGGAQDRHMNGTEALAYSRIRRIGNADYERTERQRRVLRNIMDKMKGMSAFGVVSFAETVLPLVNHNISGGKVASLLTKLPSAIKYPVTESRIPYQGMYVSKHEILCPNMSATVEKLQNELFG